MDSVICSTPTEIHIRLRRAFRTALLGLVFAGILSGCSPPWKQGVTDPRLGDNCVRNHHGPTARAINYVDPELCGRVVAKRGPVHVRSESEYR